MTRAKLLVCCGAALAGLPVAAACHRSSSSSSSSSSSTSPSSSGSAAAAPEAPLARASIDLAKAGTTIPPDFAGFSIEYGKSLHNALGHVSHPNRVFLQLMKNLPRAVLRIGGNSTDESCFEGIKMPEPSRCHIAVTADELDVIALAAKETGWRFILGVDLAQASPAAGAAYAAAIVAHVPRGAIAALEIGNEPDLYPTHEIHGTKDLVRPTTYDVHAGARDYAAYADAIRKDPRTKALPLAGPALASKWAKDLATVYLPEVGASRIDLLTTHHYPLSACRTDRAPEDPRFPSLEHLLAPKTMERLSDAIEVDVAAARSIGRPLEVDETNSISCAGTAGVSDTFGSAAWGVDYLFTAASLGASRLNFHGGSQTARYSPITPSEVAHGTFEHVVHPLYYAMLLFGYAEGGALVPVKLSGKRANVKAWAVTPRCEAGAACPALRVFLINKDEALRGPIKVELAQRLGHGEAVLLRAPAVDDKADTTLGGRTVDAATGEIAAPETRPIEPDAEGAYTVELDVADVVMLSIER